MKNKWMFTPVVLFTAVAVAQTTPATQPAQQSQKQTTPVVTTTSTEVTTNATATTNVAYVSNPDQLKGLTSESLKAEHFFPVLGSYTASGSSTGDVTIRLDETNKGIVWIEGLPQGRFKALMKKAPSTYKIPEQKTESGKSVNEGTLFLNPNSKELTIVLGRAFNDEDPSASLTIIPSKTKSKTWQYTGVKSEVAVASEPVSNQ